MRREAALGKVAVFFAVILGATTAWGEVLTPIGVLDPANPLSQIKAMTPDGQYAVGLSQVGDVSYPVVWSASSGLVQLPNEGAGANLVTEARGVIVRPGEAGAPNVVGIAGHASSGWAMQWYEAPVTNLGGSAWNDPSNDYVAGPYNAARLSGSGPTWYIAGQRNGSNKAVRQRINTFIAADWQGGTGKQVANSVSSNSIGIGYDSPSAVQHRAAYWSAINSNSGFHAIPGGSQTFSEGYGISSDGTVMSGLDGISSSEYQAFIWAQGDAGMTLLGTLPGDTMSVAVAVTAGKTAVGYSSNGVNERATIWSSTGQILLLSDLLAAAGADLSQWSQLSRVTTISDDGLTVGGWGVWQPDGSTRGFIATIPEPATLLLLGVAGAILVRRRG